MAVVYTGHGVNALHRVIWDTILNIEKRYGNELEYWDGDIKRVSGIKPYLEKLLSKQEIIEPKQVKNKPIKIKYILKDLKLKESKSISIKTLEPINKDIKLDNLYNKF